MSRMIQTDAIFYLIHLHKSLLSFLVDAYIHEEFIRLAFDQHGHRIEIEQAKKLSGNAVQNMDKIQQKQLFGQIRKQTIWMLQSLMAIIEILTTLATSGDTAEEFRDFMAEKEMLDGAMGLLKVLRDILDILIDLKLYKQEEKFATYQAKNKQKNPFGAFLLKIVKLVGILTSSKRANPEPIFMKNKEYLGLLLSFTKLDEDNP